MRREIAILAAVLVAGQAFAGSASADNKLGYKLETTEAASHLSRAGGSLGMKIGPGDDIAREGLSFQVLKVEGVTDDSPAARAGLKVGDQIIAVNARVFPNTKTFAEYVGSIEPGQRIDIDYMAQGAGPKDAKRVGVTVGKGGHAVETKKDAPQSEGGLSTGEKVAIGIGAAAIFGCYEFDCFKKLKAKYEERTKRAPGAGAPATHP